MLIFFTFKDYDIDTKLLNLFHFLLLFSCCRAAGKYTCGFCYLQEGSGPPFSGLVLGRLTPFFCSTAARFSRSCGKMYKYFL